MKPPLLPVAALCAAVLSLAAPGLRAESTLETIQATQAYAGDGKSGKDLLETRSFPSVEGMVSRVKGSLAQWDYVAYWFGNPVPAGACKVRFRLYNDGAPSAAFTIYYHAKDGQVSAGALVIPADAPKDALVTVDIPINATDTWSGLAVKKTDASQLPGPWIDDIAIVQP